MGRQKKNKPKRERFGSRFDLSRVQCHEAAESVDDVIRHAAHTAIERNGLTLATPAPGGMAYALKTFENFRDLADEIGILRGYPLESILVISDVINLEGQLSGLPPLDEGMLIADLDNSRTARAYRFSHAPM